MTKETTLDVPLTRQEIRDKILGHAPKPGTKLITLFGVELELRQPTLGAILIAQDTQDIKRRMTDMIIQYAFVPGSSEPVFEGADREMILSWPFGEDILNLQNAITDLTGINIDVAEEELAGDPLEGQSSSTA